MNNSSSLNINQLYPSNIKILSTNIDKDKVFITAKSLTRTQCCPYCGASTSKYHSTYERTLQDLPVLGKKTVIKLKAHKYYCMNDECITKQFCETVDDFCSCQRRMTTRLEDFIAILAVNSSCEGAARICKYMGITTNGDSIIRLLLLKCDKLPEFKAGFAIGVDDWAYKKGQTYGTIIVDEATHTPIELLEGRDGEKLKEWLSNNKHIKVVTRDRASAYASAISEVLPECLQVADRYHLHANLLEMIKNVFSQEIPTKIKIELENSNEKTTKKKR